MSTWVQTQRDQKKAVDEWNAYMNGHGGQMENEFQAELDKIVAPSINEYREMTMGEEQQILELERSIRFKRHRDEVRRLVLQLKWEDALAVRRAKERQEIFGITAPGILMIDHDLPGSPFYKKPKENFYVGGKP